MTKLTLVFILLLCTADMFAQIVGGNLIGKDSTNAAINTAVPFLMITPDARAGGMADAGAATSPDVNSAYWNSAKLAFIDKEYGASISYTPWLGKIINNMYLLYLSGFYKINHHQTIATSIRYFNLGEVQFNQGSGIGNQLSSYKPRELAIDVTYSRLLTEHMSIGGTLRYIYSNLTGHLSTSSFDASPVNSVAVDFGFYYSKPMVWNNSNLSFGATITNLGGKVSYSNSNTKDFLPTNLRLGTAYKIELNQFNSFTFVLDFNKLMVPSPSGNPNRSMLSGALGSFSDAKGGFSEEMREITTSFGMEYWYNDLLAARLGYFYEAQDKGNRKYLTAGLGCKFDKFGFDVAYLIPTNQHESALAETLRFTLAMSWKKVVEDRSVTDKKL